MFVMDAVMRCKLSFSIKTNMPGRTWTPEEDDALLHAATGNHNIPELCQRVADQLHRTPAQVRGRYYRLRKAMLDNYLPEDTPIRLVRRAPAWTPKEQDDCLMALLDFGYKPRRIAEVVTTRTPSQISHFIHNVLRRKRPDIADEFPRPKRRRFCGRRPRREPKKKDEEEEKLLEAQSAEDLEGQRAAHGESEEDVEEFEPHVGVDIFGVPPKPLLEVQPRGGEQRQ